MKSLLLLLLVMGILTILLVSFIHNCIFKPKRIIQTILKALMEGPKTPFQLEQATGLSPRNLAFMLDTLEHKLGFVRREAHPAIDPIRNPEAPDLVHLTKLGTMEIEPED
jgi:hypothetical protein